MIYDLIQSQLGLLFEYLTLYPITFFFILILFNVCFAVLFLPCSVFAILSGAFWGDFGVFVSVLGSVIASASTFTISRSSLKKKIRKYLVRRYPGTEHYFMLIKAHDWKVIAAIQLNPILPAASFGYFVGLTEITLFRYLLFSTFCALPLNVLLCVFGSSIVNYWKFSEGLLWTFFCLVSLFGLGFFGPMIGKKVLGKDRNI